MLEVPTPNRLLTALKASSTGAARVTAAFWTGVVEHAHKVGVRQVVEHHHQGAEHRGDGQIHHRPGDGHGFKQLDFFGVIHGGTSLGFVLKIVPDFLPGKIREKTP